ncbi:MAG: hypothetical protein JW776_07155 [Candidatus Lokiarchaeota archaeon]|nr:hypothetical protein [Candidatus Lokiarchaeota archaeon]
MTENLSKNTIEEIVYLLGNPVDSEDFLSLLNVYPSFKIPFIIEETRKYLNYFSTYLRDAEFQKRIFEIITISYEICDLVDNIPDVLVKTTFVNLLELYLDYSKIERKDEILNIFGISFDTLAPGPKILNLCLLVEPVLKSKEYLLDRGKLAEIEVVYSPMTSTEIYLKNEIDRWIKNQKLDLSKQDFLLTQLSAILRDLAVKYGINTTTEEFMELEIECKEMLTMQFTVLSLMIELGDEDLTPKPLA